MIVSLTSPTKETNQFQQQGLSVQIQIEFELNLNLNHQLKKPINFNSKVYQLINSNLIRIRIPLFSFTMHQ